MSRDELIKKILGQQRDFDEATLDKIATRLNRFRGLGLVDLFDLMYFSMIYAEMLEIEHAMMRTRQRQVGELQSFLQGTAKSAYAEMKPLYGAVNKEFIPYNKNTELQKFVTSTSSSLCNEFNDTLGRAGYSMQDMKTGKRIFHTPSETFQYILNSAKHQKVNNAFGYDIWCRNTIKKLLRDGLRIYNYNQDTHRYKQQNSYSYIKNFVKDAVYRVAQGVYNVVANQVGIDGVEISVHANPALDHMDVQGHQMTLENFHRMQAGDDFYDVDGLHFGGFDRPIGMYNCRHYVYPIIIGKSEQRYTHYQLQQIKENAKKEIQIDGAESIPKYELIPYVNNLEEKMDTLQLDLNVAKKLGDDWLINYYQTRLLLCKNQYSSMKKLAK